MKPETHCPQCKNELYHGKDDLSRYDSCRRCDFDFSQRYIDDSEAVSYVTFYFPRFSATIYFSTPVGYWPNNTIMIYSREDMRRDGMANPIVKAKGFTPNWTDLKALENRLHLMVTFS